MNEDETPTPRQSGSYAVMQGICEDTLRSLEAWRASSAASARWELLGKIEQFQERFHALRAAVLSWQEKPPAAAVKACTIEDILGARTEATDWGAPRGLAL